MHVHLPKPLHGWRAFAGEVGIIVLGVLIALSAEQLVEDWHWKQKADESQRAISAELAQDAGVLDERMMQAPCLEQELSQISRILADARSAGRIGRIQGIGGPGTRPLETAAWDAALADGTSSHFSADRRQRYAVLYPLVTDYWRELLDENRLWTHLRLLENAPGKLPDSLLTDIASSAAETSYRDWLITTAAEQQLASIRGMGIEPAYNIILDHPGTRAEVLRENQGNGGAPPSCKSITVDGRPVPLPNAR